MRQPSSIPLAAMWPVPPPWRLRGDGHGLLVWMLGGRPGVMLFEVTSALGQVASFTYESSRWSLPVDAGLLPARWRALVQVADGRSFETVPSARGRMHRARFSELVVNPLLFPDVSQGRVLAGFSLRKFEMTFPIPKIESA